MRRALALLALARAYEVYENEYANDVLPGGRGDDDLRGKIKAFFVAYT